MNEPLLSNDAVTEVARELRAVLTPLVHTLAGDPPRPVRLTQGVGLDKSLASRLVQAVRSDNDDAFLHRVPSPAGLRIALGRARGHADTHLLREAEDGVRRFETLLDRLPGGRQALDARIGESSTSVRESREQMARQASFKAHSFLFGHYCEALTTALFVYPSERAGCVDAIEVHRRIGLRRMVSDMPLPLLSVHPGTSDASMLIRPLHSMEASESPADYVLAGDSGAPLPPVDVVRDGALTTFVLPPQLAQPPDRLTTALRVLHFEALEPRAAHVLLRNYMLHLPCRRLVRDLYLAPGLWPDAAPAVGFYLPGPSGAPALDVEPGQPHLRRVNLSSRIEQLPGGAAAFALDEAPDQRDMTEHALARAGLGADGWRGWRCRVAYPVPLVEMQLALRFTGQPLSPSRT